jgi:hypothetical protein
LMPLEWFPRCQLLGPCSGQRPAGGSAGEVKAEKSAEVDRGGPQRETELVAFDAAVADAAVTTSDEPGDGSFDHGPPLPVVVGEVAVAPGTSGFDEFSVVFADLSVRPVFAVVQRSRSGQPPLQ